MEVKPGTTDLPDFLVNSILGCESVEEVVSVISQMLDDLAPPSIQQAEDGAEHEVDLGGGKERDAGSEVFEEGEDAGGEEKEGRSSKVKRKAKKPAGKKKAKKVTIAPPASQEPVTKRRRKPTKRVLGEA